MSKKVDYKAVGKMFNSNLPDSCPLKGFDCLVLQFHKQINKKFLPKNTLDLSKPEQVEKFNEILAWARENCEEIEYNGRWESIDEEIQKFRSGKNQFIFSNESNSVWVLFICANYMIYSINIRDVSDSQVKQLRGHQAFIRFINMCKKMNIDLRKYEVSREEGLKIKETIKKPWISGSYLLEYGETYENVHHIDFHNSYPAGLVNTHPEFKEVVEYFYKGRKKHPEFKAVLNFTVGYMQSPFCGFKYAQLSKDAIDDNLKRISSLTDILMMGGRKVLAWNTDGIWYQGEIFHGAEFGEGTELGQWENDHTNCTFRMKSGGSYEYIEDGKYKPVVRGRTKLEETKPRDQWQWGDIFHNDAALIKMYRLEDDSLTEYYDTLEE